jgi:hypothetical protein
MTKRQNSSGRRVSPFVKIGGKLADFLGLKASSGRYIARSALVPVEDAFRLWKETGDAIDDAVDDATRAARDAARYARDQVRTQTVSNRQRAQTSIRNRTGEVRSREKHAKHIKTEIEKGRRGYSSEASAKAAQKNRDAAYAKRLRTQIDTAARNGDRIGEYSGPGQLKSKPKRVKVGRRTYHTLLGFRAQEWHGAYVENLRERKLAGHELDNGDWHMLMDYSEHFNDPERQRLRASPGSFTVNGGMEDE